MKKDENSGKRRKFWKKTKILKNDEIFLKKDENSEKRRKFWKKTKILEKNENSGKERKF